MTEKIDYSKLTDSEIDELMATKIMGWDRSNGAYWKSCDEDDKADELVYLEGNWHPSHELNQTRDCECRIMGLDLIHEYSKFLYASLTNTTETIIFDVLHTPARQRCEAMLMTMEEE